MYGSIQKLQVLLTFIVSVISEKSESPTFNTFVSSASELSTSGQSIVVYDEIVVYDDVVER
jgi:hypothetical protein